MPTEAHEGLLDRDLSKVAAKDTIDVASPLLQELVNYSTTVFRRCEASATGGESEDLAVLMLYLHMIEITDGIEVLVSQCSPTPAKLLLRSAFEADMSIEYIIETDYVRRSLSWLTTYFRNRLDSYDSLDPTTSKGQVFKKAWADDKVVHDVAQPVPAEVQAAKANLEHMLAQPQFEAMDAEIKAEVKKRKRQPQWYQLFGGPANLRELARHLRRETQYHIFYGHWSSISHAHDISRFIGKSPDGKGAYKRLRNPREVGGVAHYAAALMLNATHFMMRKFRPQENAKDWYIREIRDRFLFLAEEGSA